MRLFLAVDIPEDIRSSAERLIARLEIPSTKVRWVKPANLHVTLKFLGETSSDRLAAVIDAARRTAAAFGPMNLSVDGMGVFPNKIKPRVVWLGLKGDLDKMAGLAEALDLALARKGFDREERAFSPHLTIGRVISDSVKGQIIRATTAHREMDLGSFTASSLVLYESQLRPGGSIYNAIESFDLKKTV